MKRSVKYMVLATLFLFVLTGLSFGGSHKGDHKGYKTGGHGLSKDFSELDTNSDNFLSAEEYKAAFPSSEKKGFDFLDTDKDGRLNEEEWQTFKAMHSGMGSNHGKKTYHGKKKYHDAPSSGMSSYNAHFGDIDTDGDSLVTPKEFKAFFPKKSNTDQVFKSVDMDKNGSLDHDEWHEFKDVHDMKHKE